MAKGREVEFRELVAKATAAGIVAGSAIVPRHMVVYGGRPGEERTRYDVPEGPCGFAWINVTPGNSPFANFLKKSGLARKAYHGGVDVWVGEYGQSLDRKEAYANAYAEVLSGAGIKAYAGSRMD